MSRSDDDRDDDREPPRRPRRRPESTNGMATASLVVGIVGCVLFWLCGLNLILGLTAIVLGIIGLARSSERGVGRGTSIAGIVTGGVALLLTPIAIGLLLPAVQKVREASSRQQVTTNAKMIGLGVHSIHDVQGQLPVPQDTLPAAKAGTNLLPRERLSWRAEILPYIEQAPLHNSLDFSKPWDSPTNKAGANTPVVYYSDPYDAPPDAQTRFRMFTGPGTFTDLKGKKPTFINVTDGTSNTILFADSATRVPWAQNNEMPFTPGMGTGGLGHPQRRTFLACMADGSVRMVQKTLAPATLDALITPDGNDTVPAFE